MLVTGMPLRVPESASCPPPPGNRALRSSSTEYAPFSSRQDSTLASKARSSPSLYKAYRSHDHLYADSLSYLRLVNNRRLDAERKKLYNFIDCSKGGMPHEHTFSHRLCRKGRLGEIRRAACSDIYFPGRALLLCLQRARAAQRQDGGYGR